MTSVTHFSTFEGGGAGRAACRIHRSLVEHGPAHGIRSSMRVVYGTSGDPTLHAGPASVESWLWRRLRPRLAAYRPLRFSDENPVLHSTCWPDSGIGRELSNSGADLLHLHWIGRAGLSIEEVGRLRQPLVWTLHDQWAFCGGEHYVRLPPAVDRRYVAGYLPNNRPAHERGADLNRLTWERKCRCWRRPMQIVCPSTWLAECVRSSALMASWPVTVIPYPIDLRIWAPFDQREARALLQLPQDCPLVLFGAMAGSEDPRKGADLFFQALQWLISQLAGTPLENLALVVVGQSCVDSDHDSGLPVYRFGCLQDDLMLRLLYTAADVFVIPSRLDNLPNMGLEAQACGTPVVGFRTGGVPDVVDDHVTGVLAEPFEPLSLGASIRWVLEDPLRRQGLAVSARQRAERLWGSEIVANEYSHVYQMALASEAR